MSIFLSIQLLSIIYFNLFLTFILERNQHLDEFKWNSESIKGNVLFLVHEFSRATDYYSPETIASFIYGNLIYFEEPVEVNLKIQVFFF